MRPRLSVFALALSLVGLGASVASLVDYFAAEPAFCAESGCATVRASAWAHPLGVPMPVLGIAFFTTMTVLVYVAKPRLRIALAVTGGAWALLLIALQAFVVGAWCKLCMVADPIAIVLAIAVVAGAGTLRFAWWKLVAMAPAVAVLPLGFALLATREASPVEPIATATPSMPAVVAQAQVPGRVTIVEFVDFECPYCRQLAPKLAGALAHTREPVAVVRKMVPLAQHPHARDAALAWCCADAQGKGEQMAEALFAAPADELTPEGCEQLAVQIGCDRDRYRAQLADPATASRIARDMADAKAAGIRSFPTVFIGDQRIGGANHEPAELLAAIERASANRY